MTFSFTCPHCGTQTDVYDQYAGQTGPCAVCGRIVTLPGRALATPPAEAAECRSTRLWYRRPSALLLVASAALVVLSGAALIAWIVSALVFPAISAGRQNAQRARSAANIHSIVAALRSYEVDHGSLPPAYLADQNGRPLHSWRVLILPYLGYEHVYDSYDFGQPWDSPQNMQVLSMMPVEYASPADPDASARYETSYMVVVGPGTAFPGSAATSSTAIRDGLGQTLLVAETVTCGVSWLEPKDFQAGLMRYTLNARDGVEIGSRLAGGAHVGLADGTTEFLTDDTPPEYIQALTTIAGDEAVPWFTVD